MVGQSVSCMGHNPTPCKMSSCMIQPVLRNLPDHHLKAKIDKLEMCMTPGSAQPWLIGAAVKSCRWDLLERRAGPCDCISPYHYRAVCGSGSGAASTQTHCERMGSCLLSRTPDPAQKYNARQLRQGDRSAPRASHAARHTASHGHFVVASLSGTWK